MPVTIATSYFLNYFLIPRYLLKGRFKKFILYFIYSLIFSIYLDMLIVLLTFILLAGYKANNMAPATLDLFFIMAAMLMVVFLAAAIRLVFVWTKAQQENQKLRLEKVEAELKFLKAQIHPHFLFNTLNNLYCLTIDKSEKAPEVVLKLSELLNYMLYECNPKFISLEKELQQAKNFIDLELLRYSDRLKIELNVIGDINNKKVAPLLLITLFENAFKHGVMSNARNSWIKIIISSTKDSLEISVCNSRHNKAIIKNINSVQNNGIGLQNLQNQLMLLYKEKHTLEILESEKDYQIKVILHTINEEVYAN
jgi:LytS/YehU family sensor histidine kinase